MKTSWSTMALALAVSAALTGCNSGGSATPAADNVTTDRNPALSGNSDDLTAVAGTEPDYAAIADPALSHCVRATGIRFREQLQALECPHLDIDSVQGLEQFSALRVLNLKNNALQDIESLSALTQLYWLDVSHNQLSDLSPLSTLNTLASLQASHNQLTGLSGLPLPNLGQLYINDNQLSSLGFIGQFPALRYLRADSNNLSAYPETMPENLTFHI